MCTAPFSLGLLSRDPHTPRLGWLAPKVSDDASRRNVYYLLTHIMLKKRNKTGNKFFSNEGSALHTFTVGGTIAASSSKRVAPEAPLSKARANECHPQKKTRLLVLKKNAFIIPSFGQGGLSVGDGIIFHSSPFDLSYYPLVIFHVVTQYEYLLSNKNHAPSRKLSRANTWSWLTTWSCQYVVDHPPRSK